MAVVLDPASIKSFMSFVNSTGTTNLNWTDTTTNKVYTIGNGFHRNAAVQDEHLDNVKYQAAPNGTVYVYTFHDNIKTSVDDPNTLINETGQHSGIITYAVSRDNAGAISVKIHQVQHLVKDSAGHQFAMKGGDNPFALEKFSTNQGDFLLLKYGATAQSTSSDGFDQITGTAIYKLGPDGKTTPVDAKVWDMAPSGPKDTPLNSPQQVNTNFTDPYVSSQTNATVVKTADGKSVLMQQKDGNTGSLTTINDNGTFGAVKTFDYTVNGTTTLDDATGALFKNLKMGGSTSVTIGGKTFLYGISPGGNENVGRAELTVDSNGVPQLTNITFSNDHQSQGIFDQTHGFIDVGTGDTTIKAAPDIGDGNKYVFMGNSAAWQFLKVNPDGSLSAASNLGNAVNQDYLGTSLGTVPMQDLPVIQYAVNGTTYTGWVMQTEAAADGRWWFYNPQTGFKAMTPMAQTGTTSEEPLPGDRDYYMINGKQTWISTKNNSIGQPGDGHHVAWVADGGTAPMVFCFVSGTQMITDRGTVAIEDLQIGDMIDTVDHGFQPIRWIGSRRISLEELVANPKLRPIQIMAGSLGVSIPHKDVMISPQHRVLLRSKLVERMFGTHEVLTAAKNLLALPGISVSEPVAAVEYYHIMLDQHELVLADGLIAETMLAGKTALESMSPAALEELLTIFPELHDIDSERLAVRQIVLGAKARKFVERSGKNAKRLVS